METKKIILELNYKKEIVNEKRNIFKGGVEYPKKLDELYIDINEDYDFNFTTDEFEKNSKYNIYIHGSDKALFELGKYLINISCYETSDPNFHVHVDDISDSQGNDAFNLIISKQEKSL